MPSSAQKTSLTKYFADLWLAWWADANAIAPNTDLGKWLGVYSALAIGAMISLLVGTWYAT
jgi:hypothetical protein